MYKLIAIAGVSCSGKDTVLNKILERKKDFRRLVRCTTRPKRENEVDDVDYHFLSTQDMITKILSGDIIEASAFDSANSTSSWVYGTSIFDLDKEKINIGVFDVNAVLSMIEDDFSPIDILPIFLGVNPKNSLLRALNREANPDVDEIIRRYKDDQLVLNEIGFDTIFNKFDLVCDTNTTCSDVIAEDIIKEAKMKWGNN